ncbi:HEAT repeat domain-containing protein [Nonomuraea sp. NPDC000554]|uniref:HEAT repeat domain-containing protein n=1 Tax=Nonomuraea sp. NPDC000554 TaxID=3154259 RepID=UPI00333034C9
MPACPPAGEPSRRQRRARGFDLLAVQAHAFSWHVPPLIEAANALPLDTSHEDLRWSAAHALATICDDERVLVPLPRFAADPDSDVRWQVARGIPIVVDPLPDDPVRVLPVLERVLADPDVGDLYVEAAAASGDPRLLPLLRKLKADGWQDDEPWPELLDQALKSCTPPA